MSEEKKTADIENLNNGDNNISNNINSISGGQQAAEPEKPVSAFSEAEEAENGNAPEAEKNPEKPGIRFFRSRKGERGFSREEWILTHIGDENLLEYLELERKREELLQKTKETRQKRILSAFQLAVSLGAVVAVIWLLRDNPTVMVNILYIIGIVAALWIWKNPRSK